MHTNTEVRAFLSAEAKNISTPEGGVYQQRRGRQTGFHTPLLGRIKPLVNFPVVKAEQ